MKHRLFASLFILLAVACGKKELDEPVVPVPADYVGTVSVDYNDTTFDNENISVSFDPAADGTTASLLIHQIKFVPQMPVTIDVTIPSITLQTSGRKILLSCGSVAPLALGGEMPRYQVTEFTGEVEDGRLTFSLNFGDYPTRFTGTKQ